MCIKNYLFVVLMMFYGCSNSFQSNEITIGIKTNENINGGTPFYVIVKEVNTEKFLQDQYDDIANELTQNTNSKEIITKKLVLPGQALKLNLSDTKDKLYGAYFLFTEPDREWKFLINSESTECLDIILEEKSIVK